MTQKSQLGSEGPEDSWRATKHMSHQPISGRRRIWILGVVKIASAGGAKGQTHMPAEQADRQQNFGFGSLEARADKGWWCLLREGSCS